MTPDLVMLHGFTHTGASWDAVVAALGTSYRAATPDIRGHGSASGLEPVTLEAVIADIDALAPERFTLIGYSMGGRIALHAAFRLPDRVQRLVLIGASPGIADPAQRAARRAADERLSMEVARLGIEEFARRWAVTPILAGLPPALAAQIHADRLRSAPEGLARALHGLSTGALPPLWDRLGELRLPVSVLAGERDEKFVAIGAEMAAQIPGARFQIVPDVGHAAHLEAPDSVATIITSLA